MPSSRTPSPFRRSCRRRCARRSTDPGKTPLLDRFRRGTHACSTGAGHRCRARRSLGDPEQRVLTGALNDRRLARAVAGRVAGRVGNCTDRMHDPPGRLLFGRPHRGCRRASRREHIRGCDPGRRRFQSRCHAARRRAEQHATRRRIRRVRIRPALVRGGLRVRRRHPHLRCLRQRLQQAASRERGGSRLHRRRLPVHVPVRICALFDQSGRRLRDRPLGPHALR